MKNSDYLFDVLIIHSYSDHDWVMENLVSLLENRGKKVCLPVRDLLSDKSEIVEVAEAAENSHHILLVLTPMFVLTRYNFYQSILSRTNLFEVRNRSIPILVKKCEIPAFLSMMPSFIDFSKKKVIDKSMQELIQLLDK